MNLAAATAVDGLKKSSLSYIFIGSTLMLTAHKLWIRMKKRRWWLTYTQIDWHGYWQPSMDLLQMNRKEVRRGKLISMEKKNDELREAG